ncbi:YtfJ family protein [Vibrio hippocampi]|uniref:YtfJ family protein n=1 Tax=Vibrio hippocampi TaxID=654686 RepID=A0ABM8ZFQ8_9VIBR|nr:YtfJ family protein [Vibrio hippocampi]CAH0524531.1 putative protein YtfJ [Vibrio hippocampi]
MKKLTLLASLFCFPSLALALNLNVGQAIPSVSVKDYGELIIQADEINYQVWDSQQMLGKVRVIQAIAGRSSAKKMNAPLMADITAANYPEADYQTTTIINQDDAIWGTGSFVKSSAEESKREFPWSSMVLDQHGIVTSFWKLPEETSTIIVLDKVGKVLFIKQGALSEQERQTVLTLISDNI